MNGLLPDNNGFVLAAESAIYNYACEINRPSHIHKPKLFIDGDMWCALYGENIQDGVAGFGKSPELAYQDFDKNWIKPIEKAQA